jgi:hypothetical protein
MENAYPSAPLQAGRLEILSLVVIERCLFGNENEVCHRPFESAALVRYVDIDLQTRKIVGMVTVGTLRASMSTKDQQCGLCQRHRRASEHERMLNPAIEGPIARGTVVSIQGENRVESRQPNQRLVMSTTHT